jgi:peptide/nickel transport system substrate-binding protein
VGQFLNRHARLLQISLATLLAALAAACGSQPPTPPANQPSGLVPVRGGQITVTVRTEPQSFSYYLKHDGSTDLITFLTQARLVRVNRAKPDMAIEPWLAESWTASEDGLRYVIKLRPNLTFADGHPFTADDVVFSFAAAYDPKAGGPAMGDTVMANGKPLAVSAIDPLTVSITFPVPFASGLRILDNLPILPKHKLEAAFKAGTFAERWGVSSPLTELTGMGPFVLSEYQAGQRLVFTRNDRYFRKDARGAALPFLDRVIVEIVPNDDAQMLRLESGQSDMMAFEIRLEDYAALKRASDAGRLQLFDLGESLDPDHFWINLRPGAFGKDPRAAWLQSEELRRAISLAVDRRAFADAVFLGAGVPVYGPVTPANRKWHWEGLPQTPHDPAAAKALLGRVGLADRDGDGLLDDARGAPARFTLSAQKGQTAIERGAAVIRDELKKIGLTVDLVLLEGNALTARLASGQGYEAAYFHLITSDIDPALNQEFWLSGGAFHVWSLGQKSPPTGWEREIDALMARYISSLDENARKRAFDEVQRIFAEHLPAVHFAAPRIFAAASSRVMQLTPAVLRPQLLWSPDSIWVRQ